MKRINVGDLVICPGSTSPVEVEEKQKVYLSGIGQRTLYWVSIESWHASYQREDLTLYEPDAKS